MVYPQEFHSSLINRILICTHLLSATERRVGFTVGVTALSSTWQGHILVFPHVVTNKGNVYNRSTGKSTAPIDGTYVFFVAVNAYASTHLYLEIVHNGSGKVRTYTSNGAGHMTGTNMAVHSGQGYWTESVPIITFSGFLLA